MLATRANWLLGGSEFTASNALAFFEPTKALLMDAHRHATEQCKAEPDNTRAAIPIAPHY